VLAYVLGRRKDDVFLKLKELLEPFGITKYDTDGWGAYERYIDVEKHQVGKENTQKIESKHINLPHIPHPYRVLSRLIFSGGILEAMA
jgi:insertion element IS1 protein InsB